MKQILFVYLWDKTTHRRRKLVYSCEMVMHLLLLSKKHPESLNSKLKKRKKTNCKETNFIYLLFHIWSKTVNTRYAYVQSWNNHNDGEIRVPAKRKWKTFKQIDDFEIQ